MVVVVGGLFDFNVSLIQTILNIYFRFQFGLELDNRGHVATFSFDFLNYLISRTRLSLVYLKAWTDCQLKHPYLAPVICMAVSLTRGTYYNIKVEIAAL